MAAKTLRAELPLFTLSSMPVWTHGFAWLCSQQDAGRGSHSRSCNPLIPRAQGAELQVPLYWCFYHFPFLLPPALMPLTSSPMPHAPLSFSLARCQPSPALPTASKPWSIPFSMAVLRKYWRQQKLCQLAAQFWLELVENFQFKNADSIAQEKLCPASGSVIKIIYSFLLNAVF